MNKRDGRKKVLFVCLGNACRSLMAEAIARLEAPDAIDAFSAGFMPIGFVPELTKQTLMKNGYWAEGLESKGISSAAWKRADVVINMTGRPVEEAFREHSKVVDWEIEDPFERGPEEYQWVFEKIRARVQELAEECKREYAANRVAERRSRPLLRARSPMSRVQQNLRIELPNPNASETAAPVQ
ncbi:MAG TPA: low molecular weight phosphatase family protein, partial [Terriglobales bacterium]|nr:low molecular weight phosphatase family protein [Terriglobales bacterium]